MYQSNQMNSNYYNLAPWSRHNTLAFIERYKYHECLWKIGSKHYNNKLRKEAAFQDLIQFVSPFHPDANRATITGKINSLRSAWRKEYKKTRSSKPHISESGLKIVYRPSLFYYDHLSFVAGNKNGTERDSDGSLLACSDSHDGTTSDQDGDFDDQTLQQSQEDNTSAFDDEQQYDDNDYDDDVAEEKPSLSMTVTECPPEPTAIAPTFSPHPIPPPVTTTTTAAWPSHKRKQQQQQQQHRMVGAPHHMDKRKRSSPCHYEENNVAAASPAGHPQRQNVTHPLLPHPTAIGDGTGGTVEDEFDCFGQTVAHALRGMPTEQTIHARKLISDVLYEGQLGNLSRASTNWVIPVSVKR